MFNVPIVQAVPADVATMNVNVDSKTEGIRSDGRKNDQLRPIGMQTSQLQRADGSVRWTQGKTVVLCSVFGPISTSLREENAFNATLSVSVRLLPTSFSSMSTSNTTLTSSLSTISSASTFGFSNASSMNANNILLSSHLQSILQSIILLHLHPRTKITVTLQVLQDDGSLLAACINAACIALMDAGIQCVSMSSAINICISATALKLANESVKKSPQIISAMFLDPTFDEEQASAATLTIAYSSNAGANGGIISSFSSGLPMNEMVYLQAMDIARRGCAHLIQFYRNALTKKIQNQYE